MLELQHIDKTFHPKTVNETVLFSDFNLSIGQGDFVSVVGSNGSGKTTILNIICGSLGLDAGDILLKGKSIRSLREHQRSAFIGRVFQDPAKGTSPSMTILENMSLAGNKGKPYGLGFGVNRKKMDEYRSMLQQLGLGLEDKIHTPVGMLSGGQRQALSLLICTMTPIDLLILDEHTAALDPNSSQTVMELTDKIVREKKITTLMVTHNLRFAVQYGSRLLMMHKGGIVIDADQKEKEQLGIDALLKKFSEISIELGN